MILLKLLFAHALGDYFLQTDYLACNKGRDNYLLIMHSILYTLGIFFIFSTNITLAWYWIILISHIVVDYLKARGITTKKFGNRNALILDQAIHYITLALAVIL